MVICNLKGTFALLTIFLFSSIASANITVFDVRKTLPLSDNEKVYKDYYLNAGTEKGLKPGMVVTVKRRMALYDSFQNKSLEELMISVGKLKIIHVQNGVSVARLFSRISRKNTPVLDYNYILIGDKVDINSIYMDRKGASNELKQMQQNLHSAIEVKQEVKKVAEVTKTAPTVLPEKQGPISVADPN